MHDEIMVTVMETRDPIGGHSQMDSDDDEDCPSSPGSTSFDDGGLMAAAMGHDITAQLAAAGWQNTHGTVGMAAAAAIVSSKKKKRPHSFETNPSIRKRQQNRLLRKLRATIDEFATRVGQQAVVLVATPGKPHASFRCFGAKPLEDVMKSLRVSILDELEHALHRQAPPPSRDDPSLYELPPLVIDGIPTPVEKMTQAQLRAFIPLMLKYSTGRGKPGWGRESTKPLWWPKEIPWANVRMDARSEDEKQKCRNAQISWTHALRQIVINCYKFHGREDLLPAFNEEDEQAQLNGMTDETSNSVQNEQTVQQVASVGVLKYHQAGKGVSALSPTGVSTSLANLANVASSASASTVSVSSISTNTNTMTSAPVSVSSPPAQTTLAQAAQYGTATVLQTINNPDGSVSLIQVDPNNPIITLPDGTTAQVQGVASALGDVTSDGVVDLNNVTEATLINHDGQLILTGEDGHEYAVKLCSVNEKLWQQGSTIEKSLGPTNSQRSGQSNLRSHGHDAVSQSAYPVVSGMISVPVSASMYQTMVQNDCTMQVVTVPKVEAGTSGGEVETISIPSGMVGTPIMMTGSEPQVLQVFSLKDGTVLTKTITSVADIKSEEPGEVLGN
ncbi:DNA-binding protein P3A2 isoform X1 [Frankliniella occidentalis]|uniref:DNA-binding protein P3A2 isoform X1 n=2 Tax=Frankliniella occidentalis TaxID=133901 RepID=A0A6J1RUU5_FRAOC|nr:DNA-binding protein P3A2 isoform X1 [Frankliniella occidentalis]